MPGHLRLPARAAYCAGESPPTPPRHPDAGPEARPARPRDPQEERDALLAYAFRALGQRALSAAELRGRLERRSENPDLIEEVLRRVQELGYQNDAQVARSEGARRVWAPCGSGRPSSGAACRTT